jgi:hypothetical protein
MAVPNARGYFHLNLLSTMLSSIIRSPCRQYSAIPKENHGRACDILRYSTYAGATTIDTPKPLLADKHTPSPHIITAATQAASAIFPVFCFITLPSFIMYYSISGSVNSPSIWQHRRGRALSLP